MGEKREMSAKELEVITKMDAAAEDFGSELQMFHAKHPEAVVDLAKLVSKYRLTAGYKRMCGKLLDYA
jgi:hypothetical protein